MVWPGHYSTPCPRACGHRSTINRNQALRRKRIQTGAKDRPYGHDPTRRANAHPNYWRPDTAATARTPSPAEGVITPGAAMVGQPAPGIARNPGVADGGIEGPVAGSIRIPTRTDAVGNPYIAGPFYGVPVTVGIQIIPVFILRISRVIAYRSLLGGLLGDRL